MGTINNEQIVNHNENKYKKTEIGEIPKEWDVKKIKNVIKVNPRKSEVEDENIKVSFVAMADISDDGIILNKNIKKYKEVNKGYTPFIDNDVLLAKITPCFENGKKALVKDLVNGIGFGSTEFHVLRGNDRVLPKYIYYYISTHYFRERAKLNMTGSAGQRRVPTSFIKNYRIPIPPLKEQQIIVSILSTVDEYIEQTDALIEKTKELKKGLMQKLLTKGIGHTEFKKTEIGEIPKEWEVKKLDDISANYKNSIVDGPFGSNLKTSDYTDEGVLVMQSNYITGGKFALKDIKYISLKKAKELERSKTKRGEILMAKIGANFGCVEIIPEYIEYAILSSNALKIDLDNKISCNLFYLYYLKYSKEIGRIDKLANTTAQPALSLKEIRNFIVPLPPLQEQQKIASILSEVDNQIEGYETKKEKLQNLKKGLMQQLLTGKKRVKV